MVQLTGQESTNKIFYKQLLSRYSVVQGTVRALEFEKITLAAYPVFLRLDEHLCTRLQGKEGDDPNTISLVMDYCFANRPLIGKGLGSDPQKIVRKMFPTVEKLQEAIGQQKEKLKELISNGDWAEVKRFDECGCLKHFIRLQQHRTKVFDNIENRYIKIVAKIADQCFQLLKTGALQGKIKELCERLWVIHGDFDPLRGLAEQVYQLGCKTHALSMQKQNIQETVTVTAIDDDDDEDEDEDYESVSIQNALTQLFQTVCQSCQAFCSRQRSNELRLQIDDAWSKIQVYEKKWEKAIASHAEPNGLKQLREQAQLWVAAIDMLPDVKQCPVKDKSSIYLEQLNEQHKYLSSLHSFLFARVYELNHDIDINQGEEVLDKVQEIQSWLLSYRNGIWGRKAHDPSVFMTKQMIVKYNEIDQIVLALEGDIEQMSVYLALVEDLKWITAHKSFLAGIQNRLAQIVDGEPWHEDDIMLIKNGQENIKQFQLWLKSKDHAELPSSQQLEREVNEMQKLKRQVMKLSMKFQSFWNSNPGLSVFL